MGTTVLTHGGYTVLTWASEGPALGIDNVTDLIGSAFGESADWVCVPVSRLDPAFFQLRTGVAGEIVQKFANYRLRLAIVGDIGTEIAASPAFRDFVREANRGRDLWFVPTEAEFVQRLTT
jgi:hypothetical protein